MFIVQCWPVVLFFFLIMFHQVLLLGLCWPYKMSWNLFSLLPFSEKVSVRWCYIFPQMFDRIAQ